MHGIWLSKEYKMDKEEKQQFLEDWHNHSIFHEEWHKISPGSIDTMRCFFDWVRDGKPVTKWHKLEDENKI